MAMFLDRFAKLGLVCCALGAALGVFVIPTPSRKASSHDEWRPQYTSEDIGGLVSPILSSIALGQASLENILDATTYMLQAIDLQTRRKDEDSQDVYSMDLGPAWTCELQVNPAVESKNGDLLNRYRLIGTCHAPGITSPAECGDRIIFIMAFYMRDELPYSLTVIAERELPITEDLLSSLDVGQPIVVGSSYFVSRFGAKRQSIELAALPEEGANGVAWYKRSGVEMILPTSGVTDTQYEGVFSVLHTFSGH